MYSIIQNARGIQEETVFNFALGYWRSSGFNSQSQKKWHMNPVFLDRERIMAFQAENNCGLVRF